MFEIEQLSTATFLSASAAGSEASSASGQLSKLGCLFGSYGTLMKEPKRDPNLENYPPVHAYIIHHMHLDDLPIRLSMREPAPFFP